jgi:hypothetical protein
VLPLALGIFGNRTSNVEALCDQLIDYYSLKEMEVLDGTKINNYLDASGDTMFNYGIDKTVKLHSKMSKGDTFFYYQTFPGAHSLVNFGIDHSIRQHPLVELRYIVSIFTLEAASTNIIITDFRAATHGTDMLLLFPMFPFDPMPNADIKVSRALISLITDFAQNGKSTMYKDWKTFDESNPTYLVMDEENKVEKGPMPYQDRYKFWDTLDVFWNYALNRGKTGALFT